MLRSIMLALVVVAVSAGLASCEVEGESRGTCFIQWTNDQGASGQSCDNQMKSEADCQAAVNEFEAPSQVINWAWMPECAESGCDGTCNPSWWSPY
jgi:hypothetical protein